MRAGGRETLRGARAIVSRGMDFSSFVLASEARDDASADPFKGELQQRAVSSILAFMPSTPNFGYHGSAGGWGDFSNNGKWMVSATQKAHT